MFRCGHSRAWIWFIATPRALRRGPFGEQDPHRFDQPVAVFRGRQPAPGQCNDGRLERVERVGLAVQTACTAVGPGDLENGHPGTAQYACQFGAVAAGALHCDRDDDAESAKIIDDLAVAGAGGAELAVTEWPSVFVDDRRRDGCPCGCRFPRRR